MYGWKAYKVGSGKWKVISLTAIRPFHINETDLSDLTNNQAYQTKKSTGAKIAPYKLIYLSTYSLPERH